MPKTKLGFVNPFIPKQFWLLPTANVLKWNVDTSVNDSQLLSAIGDVLRNNNGCFKYVFSSLISAIEINCAKILAIYRVVQISAKCDSIKNQSIIIEYDLSIAVMWSNEDNGGPWNLSFQLNSIRNPRKRGLILDIFHKGRATNVVADTLAKQDLERDVEFIAWL